MRFFATEKNERVHKCPQTHLFKTLLKTSEQASRAISHVRLMRRADTLAARTHMPKFGSSKRLSTVSTTTSVDKEPKICLPGRAVFAAVVPAKENGKEEVR